MRKITSAILTFAISIGFVAAQNTVFTDYPDQFSELGSVVKSPNDYRVTSGSPETPIWSEDFSSGIPSSWTNAGFDGQGNTLANALWEYRGTATTPSNSIGSRGAYSGKNNNPPTNTPIVSPTVNNGFVIFDSDYLDNNGNTSTPGLGSAPAPHIGTLTTGTINLTNHQYVELKLNSYYREYAARVFVAFSTDNGTTWPDSIELHTDIVINQRTSADAVIKSDVSEYIGGESQAKMRFIFDGTLSASSGSGYYYWMIDDIEINPLPTYELRFTDWNGAPAQDMVFGPAAGSTRLGHMALATAGTNATDQTRDITFDANVYNYGSGSLNGVNLMVDIYSGGALVTSRMSLDSVDLNYRDTATWNDLNTYTNAWNPSSVGEYEVVYSISSDSAATIYSDTIQVTVDPTQTSTDFNNISSSFGTENLAETDGIIYAPEIDLVQAAKATTLWVAFSSTTVAGGFIDVEIYDTAGLPVGISDPMDPFELVGVAAETWASTSAGAYEITADDIANGYAEIPLTDGTNPYVNLPAGSYSINMILYSNAGANPIQILNDETFSTSGRRLMFVPGDRWYGGFTSPIFNAPFARLTFAPNIGVNEEALKASITVAPNPAVDYVNVSFEDLDGNFNLTMTDITGRVMVAETVEVLGATKHTVDVSSFPAGVYMLNVNNGTASVTYKVSVQ